MYLPHDPLQIMHHFFSKVMTGISVDMVLMHCYCCGPPIPTLPVSGQGTSWTTGPSITLFSYSCLKLPLKLCWVFQMYFIYEKCILILGKCNLSYIDRSLTHYILLTYFSKLLRLRFLTHYTLLTYFSKLLKLRFLTHYC